MIFVAKKALDAYFINSAPLRDVTKNFAPLLISGKYRFFIIVNIFLSLEPITILSGNLKSRIASPLLEIQDLNY